MERERNLGIDILKFVCAFLVCAVHFSPSPYLRAIARVAVPVFFLLSGYFTENSCKQDAHKIGKKNLKFFIKTVIVLAIFVSLHFLFLTLTKDLTGGVKKGFLFPLWYLVALVVVNLIYYLAVRFKFEKFLHYLILPLLVVSLMLGSYSTLIFKTDFILYLSRNGLLTGLPFFLLGVVTNRMLAKKSYSKTFGLFLLLLGAFFVILQVFEKNYLLALLNDSVGDIYLSTIFAALFLVGGTAILGPQLRYKALFGDLTFDIYILHAAVARVLNFFLPLNALNVFLFTLFFSVLFELIKLLFKKLLQKKRT